MHSISIALPAEAADRLRELARRERRSPRQQAAVLVLAGLDREGEASPQPRHRVTWTAARDGEAHARIAGRPRTLCGIPPVDPRFAWPETRPRCAARVRTAEEVGRVIR